MKQEIEKLFGTIQDLPDESIELILPILEDEYKKIVADDDTINKVKTDLLKDGYTIKDVKTLKESFASIVDDYLKLVGPTSPKGRYLVALVGVYQNSLDRIIKEGFSNIVNVKVKKENNDIQLPVYAHLGDSGADVYAKQDVDIPAKQTKIIPTGLYFELPNGYEIQVRPRSGLSAKTDTKVTFGTVDNNYHGELGIIFTNYGDNEYHIHKGDRIAQLVIAPVYRMNFILTDTLGESERGEGGFGSTDE